jgi:hypothetical protein
MENDISANCINEYLECTRCYRAVLIGKFHIEQDEYEKVLTPFRDVIETDRDYCPLCQLESLIDMNPDTDYMFANSKRVVYAPTTNKLARVYENTRIAVGQWLLLRGEGIESSNRFLLTALCQVKSNCYQLISLDNQDNNRWQDEWWALADNDLNYLRKKDSTGVERLFLPLSYTEWLLKRSLGYEIYLVEKVEIFVG